MTKFLSKVAHSQHTGPDNTISDDGKIRIGGGFRLPASEIADSARIRVGGGFRLPIA